MAVQSVPYVTKFRGRSMAKTKTFNKKMIRTNRGAFRLFAYYDSFNMRSHDLESDSNGGFDFNTTLNLNMFRFFYMGGELFIEKDSVY
jgi:hypothetical protein